jgi:hypothetical protein
MGPPQQNQSSNYPQSRYWNMAWRRCIPPCSWPFVVFKFIYLISIIKFIYLHFG